MASKRISHFDVPTQGTQEEKIISMCTTLELKGVAISLKKISERVNLNHGTLYDFLEDFLEKEIFYREESRMLRWVQGARFPFQKTLDDFDFSFQPSIDQRLINELAACRFVSEGKNIIFLGQPGVGKTHLSVGLGLEAIQKGMMAKFVKMNDFIDKVEEEEDVSKIFKQYAHPRLLIFDDIDFYDTGKNASTVLFKLICQRHEKKLSTIFTSNRSFSEWGGLFGTKERASAAIDRILGDAIIIHIQGDSYRIKDKREKMKASKGS